MFLKLNKKESKTNFKFSKKTLFKCQYSIRTLQQPNIPTCLGIANEAKKIYGLQFHPEVDLTENGHIIFENFLRKIVGLHATYTILNREHYCIDYIRELVGDKKVLVMVSGGVDSTVCAALLHRALGSDRVVAIHIDNGFMRLNESRSVEKALNALGLDVKSKHFLGIKFSQILGYSCVDQFLNGRVCLDKVEIGPLKEVVDPEHKRAIIGDTFIHCKDLISKEVCCTCLNSVWIFKNSS